MNELPRPVAEPDGDGWTIALPGTPVAADGVTLDEAVEEMVDALRDYAAAWIARLRHAPNHAGHEALMRFVNESSDAELRAWLTRAALDSAADHGTSATNHLFRSTTNARRLLDAAAAADRGEVETNNLDHT